MIALAPLLKAGLQVLIGKSAETWNVPYTFSVRTVAGIAGGDIRFLYSVKVNGSSPRGENPVAVICGLGPNGREIERQIMRGTRTERRDRPPHILLGKRIIADVRVKTAQLTLDIKRALAGQPGRDRVTLSRRSMAPGAVAHGGTVPLRGA